MSKKKTTTTLKTLNKKQAARNPSGKSGYVPFSEIAKDCPWKRVEVCSPWGINIGHLICKENQCPMWHFMKMTEKTGT